jgi:riboflavin biosynthesis pyrimidine reductase
MIALETLFETEGLPSYELPEELGRRYGGSVGFDAPRVYSNFVSSVDGVVAIEGMNNSSMLISGKSEADRFVMGLLRACAEAVLIGAGTFRASPKSLWTPDYIYPDARAGFAQLRGDLGRDEAPRLVVLTARGELDPAHPALEAGALVLTTEAGARTLGDRLPGASTVVAMGGGGGLDLTEVLARLSSDGYRIVLAEGGPSIIGGLLKDHLLDELFLTFSPVLAGRGDHGGRPGLVEGAELLPSTSIAGDLLSVRKQGAHLFLRYAIPS